MRFRRAGLLGVDSRGLCPAVQTGRWLRKSHFPICSASLRALFVADRMLWNVCSLKVCFGPLSRRSIAISIRPKSARAQSRCAPARCAGARAERPVVGRERTAIAWWQGQHDQQAYCWRATHDQEQQEDLPKGHHPDAPSHNDRPDEVMAKLP